MPDESNEMSPASVREGGPVGVLGGASFTALSLVLRQGTAFLVSIVIARALGPEGKGALALIGQYAGIAALVVGFGFEAGNAYYVGRMGKTARQAVSDSLVLVIAAALVAVPALWAFLYYVVPATADVEWVAVGLGALTVPLILGTGLLSGVLTGLGRVKQQALATIAGTLVSFVVVIGFWMTGTLGLATTMASTVAGLTVNVVLSFGATGARGIEAPSLRRMRDEARYSLKSYVQNIAGYLELRQDVLLLGFLSTAAAIGVYSIGVSFAELLYFVPQALVPAVTAHVMSVGEESGVEMTGRVTRVLVAFSALLSLALALVVQPVIRIAFGPEFENAALVYLLLVPGVLSWAVGSQLQAYLATRGRLFPVLGVVALVLNLTLNLVLIPRFGIFGAAVATSVSYCAGNGYVVWVYRRDTCQPLSETFMVRRSDIREVAEGIRRRLAARHP